MRTAGISGTNPKLGVVDPKMIICRVSMAVAMCAGAVSPLTRNLALAIKAADCNGVDEPAKFFFGLETILLHVSLSSLQDNRQGRS